jgi:hypothetical protein
MPIAAPTGAINLCIATPCFGGQISVAYAASLFKLQSAVRAYRDFSLKILFKDGDALITRARASLIAQFLEDPGATHLLFVDADIGFEPDQVIRLIGCGADMCSGAYPIKRTDWTKVRKVIESGRPNPGAASLDYVLEVEDPQHIVMRGGFIRVRYAGTGFLMIRRAALEKMCAHYSALQFRREHSINDPLADSPHRFALFECLIEPETGIYLSEDFSFCKRWTDIGGEIWADAESRLNHVGPAVFYGDVATQFAPQPSVKEAAA